MSHIWVTLKPVKFYRNFLRSNFEKLIQTLNIKSDIARNVVANIKDSFSNNNSNQENKSVLIVKCTTFKEKIKKQKTDQIVN